MDDAESLSAFAAEYLRDTGVELADACALDVDANVYIVCRGCYASSVRRHSGGGAEKGGGLPVPRHRLIVNVRRAEDARDVNVYVVEKKGE